MAQKSNAIAYPQHLNMKTLMKANDRHTGGYIQPIINPMTAAHGPFINMVDYAVRFISNTR
ncbi:hypothetical protein AOT81_01920 [Xylella fastidiosa]|nr:hypothetical protein AOT81_01920 [Xylella fastidiosa]RWA45246.1 hypothetical protein XfCFBP8356_01845 [Xylella fastidiosa subsp. sandyi]